MKSPEETTAVEQCMMDAYLDGYTEGLHGGAIPSAAIEELFWKWLEKREGQASSKLLALMKQAGDDNLSGAFEEGLARAAARRERQAEERKKRQ